MLPDIEVRNIDFEKQKQKSKEHDLNFRTNFRVIGEIDKLDSVQQAIYKILGTERFQWVIYSHNYGLQLTDLWGRNVPYVYLELERRIINALKYDDRVINILDFDFSNKKTENRHDVTAKFRVETTEGEFFFEKVVTIG